jgi:hypothetical protein
MRHRLFAADPGKKFATVLTGRNMSKRRNRPSRAATPHPQTSDTTTLQVLFGTPVKDAAGENVKETTTTTVTSPARHEYAFADAEPNERRTLGLAELRDAWNQLRLKRFAEK